ncbi:MAG: hypothetical protein EB072_10265 [Betaproteobacteria bacterium]|nr:hypothetical protein [Betaproteobacteria bacterium]
MRKADKSHMNRIAEIGCILCAHLGTPGTPAEIHHPRSGVGMGRKAGHSEAIPLCPEHHRGKTGVHGLGTKGFPKHYGITEQELQYQTALLLDALRAQRTVRRVDEDKQPTG